MVLFFMTSISQSGHWIGQYNSRISKGVFYDDIVFTRTYFDIIYSTYRLVYNMDEGRFCGKAEFNAIFLRLRWKLEDSDQIAGWGPV